MSKKLDQLVTTLDTVILHMDEGQTLHLTAQQLTRAGKIIDGRYRNVDIEVRDE